jgi:hypothetical protein
MNYSPNKEIVQKYIYEPAFFGKLARSYGIYPKNEEEKAYLLELARIFGNLYEKRAVRKVEPKSTTFLKKAVDHLHRKLAAHGIETTPIHEDAQLIYEHLQNDDIVKAVINYLKETEY